ncbi:MAG: hypothetical protein AB8B84_06880 [Granulosicoccus sp.]
MQELLRQYFNIAFLMGKPQDLPVGDAQMKIGIVLAFVTYVMAVAVPYGVALAAIQALLDLAGTGLIVWVALRQTGRLARFAQAFGGLCGASAFINVASLPIYMLRSPSNATDAANGSALAEFVMLVWGLSLLAHVIRHTFEVRMTISVLIAFVYVFVWSSVIVQLMPPPALALTKVIYETDSTALVTSSHTVSFEPLATFELVARSSTVL